MCMSREKSGGERSYDNLERTFKVPESDEGFLYEGQKIERTDF